MSLNDVLHHKGLLQDGSIEDLCLDGDLHFQPPRVGLCPNEASIYQLHLQKCMTRDLESLAQALYVWFIDERCLSQ